MGIKALFTYDYGKEKMKTISDLGYDIIIKKEIGIVYSEELNDVEALVCYDPFETLKVKQMINLKVILLSSIGIDQLPVEDIKALNAIVCNNKGGYSIPMGEWIVMMLLELFKNSKGLYKNQLTKKWKMDTNILEIYDKTIGFVGTGTIASEAAKRLQGFGVNILGLNTIGKDVEYFNHCYPNEQIDTMLSLCDAVVISIPYTKMTHHMINDRRFKNMKDNSFIINIARGSIIDQDSMIENLKSGKLKGAALDVFSEEPLPIGNPLWDMDNVIITPHNSWISEKRNERRFSLIYNNLKRYKEGKELLNIVDIYKGY